jgi:hypothetical protein
MADKLDRTNDLDKGRWGINVDGIIMPGFDSKNEAQGHIDRNPELQRKKAIATPITKKERLDGNREC